MRLSRYVWIAIQIAATLGIPTTYKKYETKEPPSVQIKSRSELCIKTVMDKHWVSMVAHKAVTKSSGFAEKKHIGRETRTGPENSQLPSTAQEL